MTEYFLSVFGMCALLGALSLIHYNKDGAERAASRVLFASALLLPLFDTVISLGSLSLPPPVDREDGEYVSVAATALEEGIKEAVCARFSLPPESVEVEALGFAFTEMRADKIKITLSGLGIAADRKAIERYVEGEGLGECEVRLRVG